MSVYVHVTTSFDCTFTGVTGSFRAGQLPFVDRAGNHIVSLASWTRARNQQRNWETLTQLAGLYTQPLDLETPVHDRDLNTWSFGFVVDFDGIFREGSDDLALLKSCCLGVPMITGLDETAGIGKSLVPEVNIHFQHQPGK